MKPRYGRITRQRAAEISFVISAATAHGELLNDALAAAFTAAAPYPEVHAAMVTAVERVVNAAVVNALKAD